MREAGSANAIGCEINAKGNQQCNEYPWKQLAISATDIINLCKQGEGGKDPATHSLQKKRVGKQCECYQLCNQQSKQRNISCVTPATEIGYAGNANENQYAICATVFRNAREITKSWKNCATVTSSINAQAIISAANANAGSFMLWICMQSRDK